MQQPNKDWLRLSRSKSGISSFIFFFFPCHKQMLEQTLYLAWYIGKWKKFFIVFHCLDIFKIYQYLKSNLNCELLLVFLFTWKDKRTSRSGIVLFCSSISILFVLACVVLILCFSSAGSRHLFIWSHPLEWNSYGRNYLFPLTEA